MTEPLPIDLVPKTIYFGEGTDLEYAAYYGPELSLAYPSNSDPDQEIEEIYHSIIGSHLFSDGKNIKYTQTPPGRRGPSTMILEKASGSPVKGLNVTSPGFTIEFWIWPGICDGLQDFNLALHGWTGERWGVGKYCSMNFQLQKEREEPMSYSLGVGGQSVASSDVSIPLWSHIAICFNSASVKFYLNGELFMSDNEYKEEYRDIILMKTFLLDYEVLDLIEKTWLLDSEGDRVSEVGPTVSIAQPTYIRSIRFTTDDRYKEDFAPPLYMEV
jgi:hypothetical protein